MYEPQLEQQPGYAPVEQHQQLLPPGRFPGVPTSADHFVNQMELGGAKIEETLLRMNCKYQSLFFVAALGVVLAAVFSIVYSFFHFQLANFVDSLFLLLFGCIMVVLDIPGSPRWAGRYRQTVRKYARFLTRLTGKSLWFLYLGCMITVSLWPSSSSKGNTGFAVFAALSISLFVIAVSILGLFIAFRKSLRLEKVRKSLHLAYKGNAPEVYRKYSITDPSHGMQYEEFNRMCADFSQGKMQFDITDLGIIYNCLDEHQKSALNEMEFSEWFSSPYMTYV